MVLLLNLIPWIIIAVVGLLFWKYRKWQIIAAGILVLALYGTAQPSYIPKGDIQRSAIPEFTRSTAEIEDRNRKAVPSEIRNAEQNQKYKEGLEFLKDK